MRVAVIGSGGREHAIAHKLKQSPLCEALFALPGNGGIAQIAECLDISTSNHKAVINECVANSVDYVVVTPDNPLADGLVDSLSEAGIPCFGPSAKAAQIEASKVFAKDLMRKYGIPTARYASFSRYEEAAAYLDAARDFPIVVKADGLALGKGVLICETRAEAVEALEQMMRQRIFGESGSRVVVEEFLRGPEVSVLAFCDGETLAPMVSSMDHKRAFDGDKGKNTGGMGAVAPNPYYTPAIAQLCMERIFIPTVNAMRAEGRPFKGCLYFGLMLTRDGPKVIEYNCRFGDPETQVVLPLLQSDLLAIMKACTDGILHAQEVVFAEDASACVVMASGGYPETYETGFVISGIDTANALPHVQVFEAGTRREARAWQEARTRQEAGTRQETEACQEAGSHPEDGPHRTAGGRVLGVTATAPTLAQAVKRAYEGVDAIHFEGAHYRKDIGLSALQAGL